MPTLRCAKKVAKVTSYHAHKITRAQTSLSPLYFCYLELKLEKWSRPKIFRKLAFQKAT